MAHGRAVRVSLVAPLDSLIPPGAADALRERPYVDELLHEIAREADSGTLGHSLHHTRSQLSERR